MRPASAPWARRKPKSTGRRQHDTSRLAGNERLKVQDVDEPAFDELRLRHRRGDPQDRLTGEEDRALRHRMDIASELEAGKIVEEVRPEATRACQPFDVGGGKP